MTLQRTGLQIGVAGAGLLGRLLAWHLGRLGHLVTVVDPAPGPEPLFDGLGAAGFTAAGMLSPLAEMDAAEPEVAGRGWHSIACWAAISAILSESAATTGQDIAPTFSQRGSLMVAHGSDLGAARRVLARVAQPMPQQPEACSPQALDRPRLNALEPSLHGSAGTLHAWLLPGEAQLDTVRTLQRLQRQAPGVRWRWGEAVIGLSPRCWRTQPALPCGTLASSSSTDPSTEHFDLVIDVRGVGARPELPVRGVRGEVIWLHAPGLALQRPLRLLHPRHRVYIVPRADDTVLIGASEIESEDRSPVSLRTAVELMAAAHSVLPALAEARILRMDRNLRPALPDHRPRVHHEAGLLRLNGLYRHGWLLAPSVVDEALSRLGWPTLPRTASIFSPA